jgi:F0F1-type ATP synthase membrane subunit c/vacuolar-type H+-ATPase subunit K
MPHAGFRAEPVTRAASAGTLMSVTTPAPRPTTIRSAQTILLALAVGVLTLTAATAYLRTRSAAPNPEIARVLLAVVLLVAVSELAVYFLLRRSFLARLAPARRAARELVRRGELPPELFTLILIGGALAECAGLLGAVAFFLGAHWIALFVPLLAVCTILAQLPSQERAEALLRGLPGEG